MTDRLDDRALDRLFRTARTRNAWTEEGGFKYSGIGRARGARAMEEFQEVKTQTRVVAPMAVDHPRTQTS